MTSFFESLIKKEDQDEFDEKIDWKWYNANMRSFNWKYPPRIDTETILLFKEELEDLTFEKLSICLTKQKYLKEHLEELPKDLPEIIKGIEVAKYEEYFVIEKWVTYWSRILEIIGVKPKREFELSALTILDAKNYPIQDIYQGELAKNGTRYVGLCPFHDEKTPSFTIFTKENNWHCFGCHRSGDSIDFVQQLDGITFIQAVKKLTNG